MLMRDGPVSPPIDPLSPKKQYEIFVDVLTGQTTLLEVAHRWGVDTSTVAHMCLTARRGAIDALGALASGPAGMTVDQIALVAAQGEIDRLRTLVSEQAVIAHVAVVKTQRKR
jgi:hypothetical protein